MADFTYKTRGVCSQQINFSIEDGKIHNLSFVGGCPGNLLAIGKLVEGMDAKKVADMLRGNDCAGRGTSCADQLSKAIDQALSPKITV